MSETFLRVLSGLSYALDTWFETIKTISWLVFVVAAAWLVNVQLGLLAAVLIFGAVPIFMGGIAYDMAQAEIDMELFDYDDDEDYEGGF